MITIESDGGDGSSMPSSGILFKTNDGTPNNPTSSELTYDSGRILSSWTSGSGSYTQSYIKFQTHAENDTTFTDDMIIKGGNVGIGTTSPGGRLEIVKDAVANNNATRVTSHLSLGIKSGTQTVHNVGTSIFMGSAADSFDNYGITLQTLRYENASSAKPQFQNFIK